MKRGRLVLVFAVTLAILSLIFLSIIMTEIGRAIASKLTGEATHAGIVTVYVLESGELIYLGHGWNLVSFHLNMSNYSVEHVIAPIGDNCKFIQEWDSEEQKFKLWSRRGVREFTEFNFSKSYLIFVDWEENLTIYGEDFGNMTLHLLPGWEAPVYPYRYASNVTGDTFNGLPFHFIMKWDIAEQKFRIYSPKSTNPQFTQILKNEGLMLRSSGGDLIYIKQA